MSSRGRDPAESSSYAIRVFAIVMALVFTVEFGIMLARPLLTAWPRGILLDSVADATLLTLVVAPAVWLLVVRPIRRLFDARGQLLNRLFDVQEQERARIARDLHDEVGQHFTALLVGLRTIEEAPTLDLARQRTHGLREVGSSGLTEVRRLARGLRPGVLQDLGLAAAIERLCEDFQTSHHVTAHAVLDIDHTGRLPLAIETCLYRIVQETLTNVARHARASMVHVLLHCEGDSIWLCVEDDGVGFDPGPIARGSSMDGAGSIGLQSIRERAMLLGGAFSLSSAPGQGTSVQVRIPVFP